MSLLFATCHQASAGKTAVQAASLTYQKRSRFISELFEKINIKRYLHKKRTSDCKIKMSSFIRPFDL